MHASQSWSMMREQAAPCLGARRARRLGPRGRRLAFRSGDRIARSGSNSPQKARLGSTARDHGLRRPRAVRPRSRTSGCAAVRCSAGFRRASPASRCSCSRRAARPACRRRASPCEDFRIDYELFSETLPDEYFPAGSNWLMLGPSGPRRLRLVGRASRAVSAAASASASTSIRAG